MNYQLRTKGVFMSQIDEETILSETEAGHSDERRGTMDEGRETIDNMRLVPVAESIRYRKRAQGAEKKVEVLTEQLAQAKSQAAKMSEQLSDIQAEQKLMRKLAAAGTVDLETAVLIAKDRMENDGFGKLTIEAEADMDGVIEQLKKEKQYLFATPASSCRKTGAGATKKTAAAKERMQSSQTVLERAAKKAATTGNRTDLQEYLKLRRNFL
jgi:hypothetical protein